MSSNSAWIKPKPGQNHLLSLGACKVPADSSLHQRPHNAASAKRRPSVEWQGHPVQQQHHQKHQVCLPLCIINVSRSVKDAGLGTNAGRAAGMHAGLEGCQAVLCALYRCGAGQQSKCLYSPTCCVYLHVVKERRRLRPGAGLQVCMFNGTNGETASWFLTLCLHSCNTCCICDCIAAVLLVNMETWPLSCAGSCVALRQSMSTPWTDIDRQGARQVVFCGAVAHQTD
jgi:hypothetical protein